MNDKPHILMVTEPSADYELLDSGEGEKLERYGDIVIKRPDPQALWKKNLSEAEWKKAKAVFSSGEKGSWEKTADVPDRWPVMIGGIKFYIKPSAFKHVGVFPEHAGNWKFIEEKISSAKRDVSVLNLFGYTGGATLAAAKAGADVCHLDGSKVAVKWARDNAELSGLHDKPIRWILDDARDFVKREIKRGRKYDGIIMDPPAFGHGSDGQVWKIEEDFIPFIDLVIEAMSDDPLFIIINGYASGYSPIAYGNILLEAQNKFGGEISIGEIGIRESQSGRILPAGIFGRWEKK